MGVADGLVTACGGFLIAVLWMDLIFDTQVRTERGAVLPEATLSSIAAYYRRATTTSRPMSRLIAVVMVILLGALAFRALRGNDAAWFTASSVVLAAAPVLLGLFRTVPNAVRLGARTDDAAGQSRLARSIFRDHIACLAAMALLVVLTLVW
ncbi:hypothetical protein DVS77_06815 [Mycolicibacterium moriokaense]|nr:hypothetical protein DVS77_06815 [Mycolicibacterium moriokaense]